MARWLCIDAIQLHFGNRMKKLVIIILSCLQVFAIKAHCSLVSDTLQDTCRRIPEKEKFITAVWKHSLPGSGVLMYIEGFGYPRPSDEKGQSRNVEMDQVNVGRYLDDPEVENAIRVAQRSVFNSIAKNKVVKLLDATKGKVILHFWINVNEKGYIDAIRMMAFGKEAASLFETEDILHITNNLIKNVRFKSPQEYDVNDAFFFFTLNRDTVEQWLK